MKHYALFITVSLMFYNYEEIVAGTLLDSQKSNLKPPLNIPADDPDAHRNVSELITSKGYPLEEHIVQTADGYLLSVQRIPYGRNSNTKGGDKEVVLLDHGELGDGKTWFLNPPGQSLGYILPDAGYDVWVLNNRGSTYSKKNVRIPTNTFRFWKFSFQEMAEYDAPATIDYILEATGKEALFFIGFSRGTTIGFAMLSELPEYNKKVKLLVALAPVAYISHLESAVKALIPVRHELAITIMLLTKGEFLPDNEVVKLIREEFCAVPDPELCENFFAAIGGQDRAQLNETRLPIYSAQLFSSSSIKSLDHTAQIYESDIFRKYDHGARGNLKAYNQKTPPEYQLSNIKTPVALFWSTNDKIAVTEDVEHLMQQLESFYNCSVPGDQYNHFDFIWAINSPELIYKPILELLSKHK